MNDPLKPDAVLPPADVDLRALLRTHTPARLFVDRTGASYRTATWLQLREDHSAARDAVQAEFDMLRDFGPEFIERHQLFEVRTRAADKRAYLLQPELGRSFDAAARRRIETECPSGVDCQIVIGDGLSPPAVAAQVPTLLPLLCEEATRRGMTIGRPFVVRYCRVGILNEIGALIDPAVVVLLIGERPGLATADSLSAYLGYRPGPGQTDADRNLVSNIHARGVDPPTAVRRVLGLVEQMRRLQTSGVGIKEEQLPASDDFHAFGG
jgi:ethanolamine ammonia-lyase small subunit